MSRETKGSRGIKQKDTDMRQTPKIVEIFEKDARFWGLSTGVSLIIAAIPVILVLVMAATIRMPDLYVWLTAEDSFLEWLQFVLVFTSSLMFAWSGFLLLRNHQVRIAAIYLLIAFVTFFISGEEIAWGQRVFGWGTPEALEAINSQQETTLHNISSAHPIFIYGMMLAGLYGVLIPILGSIWSNRRRNTYLYRLLIPPLCLVPAFLMPFGYRFSRLALGVDSLFPRLIFAITKFSEVTEVCFYFALLVFAWLNLRQNQVTRFSGTR